MSYSPKTAQAQYGWWGKRFKDKFSTRSKSIISNITNLVQDKTKQRVILWNYIDQMITFSITLGHGSNNFDDSNGNDGNGLSAFDQLLDIISAVFVWWEVYDVCVCVCV